MTRPAVARQAFLYHNRRPPAGFAVGDYPRGRWVRNLLGADADITQWNESIIPGTGTGTITENGTQRIFTATGAGTLRAFVGVTYAAFDTAKWYAFGARCASITSTGTWTRSQIYVNTTPTAGEQDVLVTAAGRWCVVFNPSDPSSLLRLGIGIAGNETVLEGEQIVLEDPFLFELADENGIPPEYVGSTPVIIPYDNPCSLASNVITQAAYGAIQPYKRSDVVLFAGDSFGNDSSEYPTLVRNAYQIEAHITNTAENQLDEIGTQITDYIANPSTSDPINLAAKVCVMNGGINDILADVSLETMQSRLNANIAALRAADIIPVVLCVAPWKANASWSSGRQTVTDNYNAWLLARTDILTVNIYDPLEDPSTADTMLAAYANIDGLHPNSAGSAVIQARVTNVLKRIAAAVR